MRFTYDETSPSYLRWAVNRSQMKAGDVAGSRLDNTTGVKGVTRTATGFCARVQAGATRHQKTLPTLEEAAAWVQAKRQEVHGEFTKHS